MTVLGLCHICSKPTSINCGLCGKPTCNEHLSHMGGMAVCPSCRLKFDRGKSGDRKFME